MGDALPLKNIPRKSFRFKPSEFGYTATHKEYEIHVGQNNYWWWDVEYNGSQIAESDRAGYKTDAPTRAIALKRAISALNKWRADNL